VDKSGQMRGSAVRGFPAGVSFVMDRGEYGSECRGFETSARRVYRVNAIKKSPATSILMRGRMEPLLILYQRRNEIAGMLPPEISGAVPGELGK